MDLKDQIGSACAQLLHTKNQIKDENTREQISSAVAQLIHTKNQIL
jgi:glutamate 5-kinase